MSMPDEPSAKPAGTRSPHPSSASWCRATRGGGSGFQLQFLTEPVQARSGRAPRQLWALPKPQPLYKSRENNFSPTPALSHGGVLCSASVPSDEGNRAAGSSQQGGAAALDAASSRALHCPKPGGKQVQLVNKTSLASPWSARHQISRKYMSSASGPATWVSMAPAVGSGPAGDHAHNYFCRLIYSRSRPR